MNAEPAPHTLSTATDIPDREHWRGVNDRCAIARSLEVISTRTAFLIMREAFYGATRFDQFATRAQISEPVAAARLKELTQAGLLEKVPYREPGQRTRSEYRLTEMGADLLPTLLALWDWGERWLFADGARIEFDHVDCGGRVHSVLTCEQGHQVRAEEIEIGRRR